MSVALTYVWTAIVLCSIISLVYIALLLRFWIGAGYKIFIITCSMLLVANLFYIGLLVTNYVLIHYIMGDYPDMTDETLQKTDFYQCSC